MRRNYLEGRAAAGYNFNLLLRWFRRILCALVLILARAVLATRFAKKSPSENILHGRLIKCAKPTLSCYPGKNTANGSSMVRRRCSR